MWNMKTTTVLLVIGALGVIKKGVNEYLGIPGSSMIGQMQKITLLGIVHILRKVLSLHDCYIPQVYGTYPNATRTKMKLINNIIIIIK